MGATNNTREEFIAASPSGKDVVITVGNPATLDFPQRFYRIVTPLQA